MTFSSSLPAIDIAKEVDLIVDFIKDQVKNKYKRDGIVVGISGGVDSAVTSVLSARAVGVENVQTLIMPEKESNPISAKLALELAKKFEFRHETTDLTSILECWGIYKTRNETVKKYIPEFDGTQKWKLVQPGNMLASDSLNYFSVMVETASGRKTKRLAISDLRTIIANTDLKQRSRMSMLYKYAESMNYVVAGTTNLSEAWQGFYVKYGDGGVDIEPLCHLNKTYVYQIAKHIGVPAGIIDRLPSPDTFSAEVADEEFFFRLPYDKLDLFLWAVRDNVPADKVSKTLGIELAKAEQILKDIKHKYAISEHLRIMPASPERKLP